MGEDWTPHWRVACTPCVERRGGAAVTGAASHAILHSKSRTNRAWARHGKRAKGTHTRLPVGIHPDTCLEGGLGVLARCGAPARVRSA